MVITKGSLPKEIDNWYKYKEYKMKEMTATEHMELTGPMAFYPDVGTSEITELMYLALGISDEAGEVAGKIKKLYRDGPGSCTDKDLALEMGDVYWYLGRLCNVIKYTPEEIMAMNYEKLKSRQERGKLGGSGDER